MKKVLITSLCALFLNINCLKAQTQNNDCNKKSAAVAEQVNGIYIFTDSKPVKGHCVNFGVISKGYISSPFDNFVFKKNKKFPHASKTLIIVV